MIAEMESNSVNEENSITKTNDLSEQNERDTISSTKTNAPDHSIHR